MIGFQDIRHHFLRCMSCLVLAHRVNSWRPPSAHQDCSNNASRRNLRATFRSYHHYASCDGIFPRSKPKAKQTTEGEGAYGPRQEPEASRTTYRCRKRRSCRSKRYPTCGTVYVQVCLNYMYGPDMHHISSNSCCCLLGILPETKM